MGHLRAHACAGGFALIVGAYGMRDIAATTGADGHRCVCKLVHFDFDSSTERHIGEYTGDCTWGDERGDDIRDFCDKCFELFGTVRENCDPVDPLLGKPFRDWWNSGKKWCRCKQFDKSYDPSSGNGYLDFAEDRTHNLMRADCDRIDSLQRHTESDWVCSDPDKPDLHWWGPSRANAEPQHYTGGGLPAEGATGGPQ
mmetsp:Transcript_18434/g.52224  ORF Transcript_18434/g.52224 Transcript_18434/m.52224 type:complete len:198 (-) Transcript_18434:81-674(-)